MSGMNKVAAKPAEIDHGAALRGFFGIADAWGLSTDQQIKLLGSPPRSTFFKWKKDGGTLSNDTLERISHVQSVYRCLHILFTEDKLADGWINQKNSSAMFGGKSALDFLTTTGSLIDLYKVRSYLDAQRGG